ncbi:MAG: hypothetical protein QNJ77_03025 [Acidimicrobiia bacterium]|nr:hypothetical protein [Acidimicrobiia bacterium]
MRGQITLRRVAALLVGIALLAASCSGDNGTTTTAADTSDVPATTQGDTVAPTTTTEATTATTAPPTVTASTGIDQAVVDRLTEQIVELIAVTEEVRGLPFLAQPTVTIVTPEELAERVRQDLEEEIDSEELAVDSRLMKLLGLLDPGADLEAMLIDLYSEQVAGFYDGETGEMVIAGEAADLSPLTKSYVVHELIHALTDQHFLFNDDFEAMFDEERYDEGSAFQALIEGDATYFQLVYVQQLPLDDQFQLATEALEQMNDMTVFESVPVWIQDDLAFPYDSGQYFVQTLVESGGIAAVDAAYTERPVSTEVIMHPQRFGSGEKVLEVESVDIALDGYEVHETSVYGEWGFRLLLSGSAAPGVAAQAANGWGGDSYQVLFDADDVLLAIAYKGDTEDDAFELADALIAHVTDTMELGEGVATGGGVSFTADDGRYAYLDRIGDGFVFVVSSDATAGEEARAQLRVP